MCVCAVQQFANGNILIFKANGHFMSIARARAMVILTMDTAIQGDPWRSPNHRRFQYQVMVIHDDWMIWGYPHELETSIYSKSI